MAVKRKKKKKRRQNAARRNISTGVTNLPPAPIFDSETGIKQRDKNLKMVSESLEQSIFLMQRLRNGQSKCLTFFDSEANTH